MATVPAPLFRHTETHRVFQLSTKWSSYHLTLERLVGGMLTLHTIPLYLDIIAYGEIHQKALFHCSSIRLDVVDLN